MQLQGVVLLPDNACDIGSRGFRVARRQPLHEARLTIGSFTSSFTSTVCPANSRRQYPVSESPTQRTSRLNSPVLIDHDASQAGFTDCSPAHDLSDAPLRRG